MRLFWLLLIAVLLLGGVYVFASRGPLSLRAEYHREVSERLAEPVSLPPVTDDDLARLPEPLQRYLHLSGAVGQPQARYFRASWRGRIRGSPDGPWMPFRAEQQNFIGEPARFFLMHVRRGGVPVEVLHAFRGDSATMRVRLLSLIPILDAGGPEMTRAEVVTLFNDLCLLAPAALVDPGIRWEPIDEHSVRGFYGVGADTIGALLSFDDMGELVDFVSDDRLMLSPDGKTFTRQRWSTPVSDFRTFGTRRAFTRGEGRWQLPEGDFVYLEIELLDLAVNQR